MMYPETFWEYFFSTNGLLTMEECSFVYLSLILDTVLIESSSKVLENFLAFHQLEIKLGIPYHLANGKIHLNKSLNDLLIIFNVYILHFI